MKKIPFIFSFIFSVIAGLGSAFAQSGTCGGNLTWNLKNGVLTISGTGPMEDIVYLRLSGQSSAPWFYDRASITSIIIKEGVTNISSYAFYDCDGLISVTIPNSVISIGERAFCSCNELRSIIIPNGVTSIEDRTFESCEKLSSVIIGNGVSSIGKSAFSECSSLSSVTIPNSVNSIGECAFTQCINLKSITIPNSVVNIGSTTFSGCSGLTSPVFNEHVFAYMPQNYSGAYTIPDGIKTIAGGAFWGCKSLTSVTIPNSVTSIGNAAFSECSSLTSVDVPNSVTSIDGWAFNYCNNLNSPVYNEHVFAYLPRDYSGAYTIPDGIETIAATAFYGCTGLTSITIPISVTSIGFGAFHNCTSLTYIKIPDNVASIGEGAFEGCPITSLTIPNSVTSFGDYNFVECLYLTSPIYNDHVFAYLPDDYSGAFTIPDGIEIIAGGAFSNCSNLTSISIPNSVTSIGNSAFSGCSGLTSVTIPNSVKSIGNDAFRGCASLSSIIIPNSVTSIGDYAFYECSGLTSVTCYPIKPLKLGEGPLFGDDFSEITFYVPIGYGEMYNNEELGRFHNVEEIYVKPAILLSSELDAINAQIASIGQQHNELISHSPYAQYLTTNERNLYMHPGSPAQIPDSYDFDQAKAFCDTLQRRLNALRHIDPVAIVKRHLRTTRPDDFVAAYFQEYPAEKEHLGGEYKEYRCHYPTLTDFVIQYEQGRLQLSERNCRETRWAECADYYASREQFDVDYNQGESVINDYRSRIDQTWASLQNLPEKVLKKNLQGASEESNEDIVTLLGLYHQLDTSPAFQLMAADFLLSNNKKLGKEYEKNGAYFSSKTDFIAAYFSKDYKQILKSKK